MIKTGFNPFFTFMKWINCQNPYLRDFIKLKFIDEGIMNTSNDLMHG